MSNSDTDLRKSKLAERDGVPATLRAEKSTLMAIHLNGLEVYNQALSILYFMNFRSEIETLPLIEQMLAGEKIVALPLTIMKPPSLHIYKVSDLHRDLQAGYQNIPEPNPSVCPELDPAELDVVIVPGSVFDKRGGRMGYGGGYYDRFLADSAPQATRIGVCFELQMVDAVPLAPHDQLLDFIVTEDCVYECFRGKSS